MDVDRTAPAIARSELEVPAAPEVVWEVLTDFSGWPRWNPDVRSVAIDGTLAPGATFRWKSGPGTITSTLRLVEPPHEIAWTGRTLGIRAVHVYRLEPRGDSTLVVSEESWDGLLVKLLRGPLRRSLQKTLDSGLGHLRAELERRAA